MARIVSSLKHQHKFTGNNHHHHQFTASGIPAIQITHMTLDEGTDDEADRHPSQEHSGVEEDASNAKDPSAKTEAIGECSANVIVPAAASVATASEHQMMFPKESAHSQPADGSLLSANKYQDRSAVNRQSTGTLNRLILVAQALESEVDWRRRNDVNSTRIVFSLRMANIILLLLINLLLFTGIGQYHDREGIRISLYLTMDKWNYKHSYPVDEMPPTFAEMHLTGQFCATALAVFMLLCTVLLQCIHCFRVRHSKLLCIFYAFACVPVALFIFGLEMHYSACPWLDDFYQSQLLRRNFNSMEIYFDTQCGINGWALAGIFSLLSCGLFVSDGLISAFFKTDDAHGPGLEKPETIL